MSIIGMQNIYDILTAQGIEVNVNGDVLTISYDGVNSDISDIHSKHVLTALYEVMSSETLKHFMTK